MENEKLVAVCGLYCGACEMYRAYHDNNEQKLKAISESSASKFGEQFTVDDLRCDGCLGEGYLTPYCRRCQIRLCNKLGSGTMRCSDCEEFPCTRISDFCNDGVLHHAEVLENLRQIREMEIEDWAGQEKERWTCPKCQVNLSWYDAACPNCRTSRSEYLFPLRQS